MVAMMKDIERQQEKVENWWVTLIDACVCSDVVKLFNSRRFEMLSSPLFLFWEGAASDSFLTPISPAMNAG
jgi:hypothetical protein